MQTYQRNGGAFARHDKRQGAAPHFSDDNHDLALAGLLLGEPAIDTLDCDTERNIANKISRGGFTAVFFLQCMEAIGVPTIHMHDG
jgi:hypothetical protein